MGGFARETALTCTAMKRAALETAKKERRSKSETIRRELREYLKLGSY